MDTHVRLLVCNTEGTIEEMPQYEGPPEHDDVLNFLIARHRTPSGEEHLGHIMVVEAKHWYNEKVKASIISQILDSTGHTGLDPAFYEAKNTLAEDALKCFAQHNRNPACGDYKTDAKRLKPDTSAERKEAGLDQFRSTTFLCDFCPVKSMVMQAAHDKSGVRN